MSTNLSLDASSKFSQPLFLAEFVQNFLLSRGIVSYTQYVQFYDCLNNSPEIVSNFLSILFLALYRIETGSTDSLVDLAKEDLLADNPQNFILELNQPKKVVPKDPPHSRESVMNTIHFVVYFFKFDRTYSRLLQSVARWLNCKEKGSKTVMDDIISIITAKDMSLYQIDKVLKLVDQASHTIFAPNFDYSPEAIDAKLMCDVAIPRFLQRFLASQNQIEQLLNNGCLLFLQHPLLPENRMLCLFHMMRQFVMMTPLIPREYIQNAIQGCKRYYTWPKPYGEVAGDMLKMLTVELKAPGAALRKRILQETPALVPDTPASGKERTIWVFVSGDFDEARIVESLLKESFQHMTLQELQANILKGALSAALNVLPSQLVYVQHLTKDELAFFTKKAISILADTVLLGAEAADSFRKKQLIQLNEIIVSKTGYADSSDTGFVVLSNEIQEPSLDFEFIKVSGDPNVTHLMGIEKIPTVSTREAFSQIAEHYAKIASSKPAVKLMIVGDDRTLHSVITGYCSFRSTAPTYFKDLDFQLFIAPLGPCEFSAFLARYDGWYGRNVVIAVQAAMRTIPVMIAPELLNQNFYQEEVLRKSQNQLPFLDTRQMNPGIFLREELQHFVREARWKLNLNLYKCECTTTKGQVMTIPFCERVEISSAAENAAAKKSTPKDQPFKPVKFGGAACTIKFTQMNVLNIARNAAPLDNSTYSQIVLANIPFQGDKGVAPNPSKNWVEMFLWDKKKKTADDLGPICYHVGTAEIETSDKKKSWHVLIDQVLYGPFVKIKISPYLQNEEPIHLPVMTFFPLSLDY